MNPRLEADIIARDRAMRAAERKTLMTPPDENMTELLKRLARETGQA